MVKRIYWDYALIWAWFGVFSLLGPIITKESMYDEYSALAYALLILFYSVLFSPLFIIRQLMLRIILNCDHRPHVKVLLLLAPTLFVMIVGFTMGVILKNLI